MPDGPARRELMAALVAAAPTLPDPGPLSEGVDESAYATVTEAAEWAGVSSRAVRYWIDEGCIRTAPVAHPRHASETCTGVLLADVVRRRDGGR